MAVFISLSRGLCVGLVLAVLFSLSPEGALAGELALRPLQVSNRAPLAALCGVPAPASSRLLAQGKSSFSLAWDLANNYTAAVNGREQLLFDGESHRLALQFERGFADRWAFGLDIPFLAHRRGSLDNFIESWHNFFSLPQGGRDLAQDNQLDYHYRHGALNESLLQESSGLGDISFSLAYQLKNDSDSALALHASLELPTGDESKWLGSGSLDASFWLSGDKIWQSGRHRTGLMWSGGLLATDGQGLLSSQRRRFAALGSLGLAWSQWQNLLLQLQLDGHTALFDGSSMRQLDRTSVQLSIGGAVRVTDTILLELAVVEDVMVDTASDVVFHLRLSHAF